MNKRERKGNRWSKRMGCLSAIMILATMAMTGCNNGGKTEATTPPSQEEKNVTLNVKEVATDILNKGDFSDQLEMLEPSMFEVIYQDVDMNQVVAEYAYTNAGASAEQIVVVEAADTKGAEEVREGLQLKVQSDIEANKDYLPNEIPKLESPVLEIVGNYVIFCVSNDNEKVKAVIDSLQ